MPRLAAGLLMVVGSVDLDESGGRFRAEGFLDLFAVGFEVVHCCREVFFYQEVLPHRSVRMEFIFAVLVGHELLVCHAELFDGDLAAEPAEHVGEFAIAVSPLDPAADADGCGGLAAVGVEEVAVVVSEEGSDVFAAGDVEACLELLAELLGMFGRFGFKRDFDEEVVCHVRSSSVVHREDFVVDSLGFLRFRADVPSTVVDAPAFVRVPANVDEMRRTNPDKAPGMYWLTGSQKFELMEDVSESLSGRIGIFNLHPLSNREIFGKESLPFLPEHFAVGEKQPLSSPDMFRRIWLGAYPELFCARSPDKYWASFYQSYVQTYLERDIRKLTQVADLNVFYAFLKASAARSGQMLNYSDLARDSGISVPTATKYMSLLETSGIAKLLYPYSTNQSAPMVSTPKRYFLDTGLMAYLTDWTNPQVLQSGAAAGHFFETWCVSEILKSYSNAGIDVSIYYFRTKERRPSEIDVLIVKDGTIYPAEVLNCSRRCPTPLRSDVVSNAAPDSGGSDTCWRSRQWSIPRAWLPAPRGS